MPPIYEWFGHDTGVTVRVIRSVADIEVCPTFEEQKEAGMPEEQSETNWERILCAVAKFVRGPSWSGKKGEWIYLLIPLVRVIHEFNTWI